MTDEELSETLETGDAFIHVYPDSSVLILVLQVDRTGNPDLPEERRVTWLTVWTGGEPTLHSWIMLDGSRASHATRSSELLRRA